MMKILSALLIAGSLNKAQLFITNATSDHKHKTQLHASLISELRAHCRTPSRENKTPLHFVHMKRGESQEPKNVTRF